jgi:heat shock protein HslJ
VRLSRGRRLACLSLSAVSLVLAGCSGGDPLDGTSWRAVEIAGRPVLEDVAATSEFSGGEVGGSSSCNSYTGTYEVDGSAIVITNVGGTEMACDEPVMTQEAAFSDALLRASSYRVAGDRLELYEGDELVLAFVLA